MHILELAGESKWCNVLQSQTEKEGRMEHEASLKRQAWWHMPVILAAWETEKGRSYIEACLGNRLSPRAV